MKFYIASSWANRDLILPVRDKIQALGHTVTSTWLDEDLDVAKDGKWRNNPKFQAGEIAERDVRDINRAGKFVFWGGGAKSTTGGAWWEFGYAYGKRKPIYVVEPKAATSIFGYLRDGITLVDSWDSFIEHHLVDASQTVGWEKPFND